ncbi:hypothetical protein [Bacillus sp. FJAT-26390]|uniref:hypothetical protein n=1 Tax=Bacillus sp. FJAT-26390 TaxID=1743142 RepID=UPI00080816E1|nr:hypothetical protein [Bacillus sp. FJAT-26390]OBZ10883.1 hypothetical protein A7975_17935 [Bacillus sp. FJAT-26390]
MFDYIKEYIGSFNPIVLTKTIQLVQLFTFVLAIFTLFFTIYNVNRAQKRSRSNDIEKFKRDLNLKTADDMIEVLSLVKDSYREIMGIKSIIELFMNNKADLPSLMKHFKKVTDTLHDSTLKMAVKHKQRLVILEKYSVEVEFIYSLSTEVGENLVTLESWYDEKRGRTDNEISGLIKVIDKQSRDMIDRINKLQLELQIDFIGTVYK